MRQNDMNTWPTHIWIQHGTHGHGSWRDQSKNDDPMEGLLHDEPMKQMKMDQEHAEKGHESNSKTHNLYSLPSRDADQGASVSWQPPHHDSIACGPCAGRIDRE